MKKKELQDEMQEQQMELKSPLELFQFIDEYYTDMDSESKMELLGEVQGIHILSVSDKDLSLPEYKFEVGRILKNDFKRETREPRPILLGISLDGAPDCLIEPLARPTTPEQLEYLRWLVNIFNIRNSGNIDVNGAPDHVKEYLRECGVKISD